jgi:hypothetical protein
MDVNAFLMENNEQSLSFFLSDAFVSISRAWSCIDCYQPETLATFDQLTKEAEASETHVFAVALKQELWFTTPLAALAVGNVLYSWTQAAPNFPAFQEWIRSMWRGEDTADARLLENIIDVLRSISSLENESPPPMQRVTRLKESLTQAAQELDKAEKLEEALACAMSAINFANFLSAAEAEAASSFALSLAKRIANHAVIAVLLSQRAHFLGKLAQNDPSRRLEAFDAFEAALGYTPADPKQKEAMLTVLESWIYKEDYLGVLKPMFWVVDDSPALSDSVHRAGVATATSTIWSGPLSEWVKHIHYVQALTIETANARRALMPNDELSIRAKWNTWSIEHTKLRRAIPHGSSIKREQYLHDILLELSHEVTHVFSMFGFIGITLTAMRWAVAEMELDVWGRIVYQGQEEFGDAFRVTPAPLKDADLLSVGFAERGVELERKIQLLENTWAPWFEGLAIFGELTADPELDNELQSPVGSVVNNLWDRSLAAQATKHNISIEEEHKRDRAESDALIAAAIRNRGEFRLRTYLKLSRQKYLAGYLAVRSVVAQWRKTLGKPLRGDQAFRILLHMTRFGDYAAIPDLSLSLNDFEKEVVSRHVEWIQSMATVSRKDLEEMLDNERKPREARKSARWTKGSLETMAKGERDQLEWDFITGLEQQCLFALVGDRAPAPTDRVPEADEVLESVMTAVAQGLAGKKHQARLLSADFAPGVFSRLVVLPLAQTVSTFWLCQEDRVLVCLICSLEQDAETGTPGYDLLMCPLDENDFLALQAKVQLGGARRLTCTRVIDLMNEYDNRNVGSNFIVFQYEDWVYIQPRGILFGSTQVSESLRDAIIERLSPDTLLLDQEALTGDNHPCVRRTLSWLEANDWTQTQTGENWTVDIEPWALKLSQLCTQVLSHNFADVEKTSSALLRFVFGDSELANSLHTNGLEALSHADPPRLQEVLSLLLKTAISPVDNAQYNSTNEAITSIMGGPLFGMTPTGLDFVSPAELNKGATTP